MSSVEVPPEPEVITDVEVEALKELRLRHDRELREFEEDSRRRRKKLMTLKRQKKVSAAVAGVAKTVEESTAALSLPIEAKRVPEAAATEAADVESAKVSGPSADSKIDPQAEIARLQEWFESERSRLESELREVREQQLQTDIRCGQQGGAAGHPGEPDEAASDAGESVISEGEPQVAAGWSRPDSRCMSVASFRTAEEPASTACSAVCSAAASRSASPCGSDAAAAVDAPTAVPPSAIVAAVAAVAADGTPTSRGAQAANVSVAPPPKAGGKGKGKGKNMPQPPPPPKNTPRQSLPKNTAPSRYVNVHWKASDKPEVPEPKEPFLARLKDPRPREEPIDRSKLDLPPKVRVPEPPNTAFCPNIIPDGKAPEPGSTSAENTATASQLLSEVVLDAYFRKSEAKITMNQVENSRANVSETQPCKILDQKRLNMLGIMLQKHLMEHKEENSREAILNIKRSLLQCNFQVLRLEALSVIRTVLRQHAKDKHPLCTYVEKFGEDAISKLEYPEHHYLVYELSKVPQVDERLECMLFNVAFKESLTTCRQNLETLRKALDALKAKCDLIRRFFMTAHRLGQKLTQRPSRGFQLSTLEKLTHTKSTKMQHLSLLHFCLALMSREDAQALFTSEDITLLRNARALGTHKVCEECRELASGLYGVKQIYESGEYTCRSTGQAVKIERRRKTLPPSAAALPLQEPVIDTDDCFHEVMKSFVQTHEEEADDIINQCHKIILMYKELAIFFDDLNSVYPPKKNDTDKKGDLLDIFYRFAEAVPAHRDRVEAESLRELIACEGAC